MKNILCIFLLINIAYSNTAAASLQILKDAHDKIPWNDSAFRKQTAAEFKTKLTGCYVSIPNITPKEAEWLDAETKDILQMSHTEQRSIREKRMISNPIFFKKTSKKSINKLLDTVNHILEYHKSGNRHLEFYFWLVLARQIDKLSEFSLLESNYRNAIPELLTLKGQNYETIQSAIFLKELSAYPPKIDKYIFEPYYFSLTNKN